jgi:hypothetical protein
MSNVDESLNESKSSIENPILLNENENQHDPFKFPNDDNILFSRLLSNSTIWQTQPSNNCNANLNMPILNN